MNELKEMPNHLLLESSPVASFNSKNPQSESKNSSSTMVYNSVIAPNIKCKVSKLYRIESTKDARSTPKLRIKRQQLKTVFYFLLDAGLTAFSIYTVSTHYDNWLPCTKRFCLWIITVIIFTSLSLLFDFASWVLIRRNKLNSQAALTKQGKLSFFSISHNMSSYQISTTSRRMLPTLKKFCSTSV